MKKTWDHNGKIYNSFCELCEEYGKSPDMVRYRLQNGWSLGAALMEPSKDEQISTRYGCKDHENNSFRSISQMCAYWGISRPLYQYRIRNGWSLQAALTTPIRKKMA